MLLHSLFENLHIHHHKKEDSEFAHVPEYTPTIIQKIEGDHEHHHHHHVYHLHRSATNSLTVCPKVAPPAEDNSFFVAEPGTDRRGIFRTIEPIWACKAEDAPDHKTEANSDGLIIVDDESQKTLEDAYKKKASTCQLASDSTTGACMVKFDFDDAKDVPSSSETTGTTASSSSAATATDDKKSIVSERQLVYNSNIKRMTTPVWWFEKVGLDGNKELARFDWKNQIRLEAYEDSNATLALTDKAFSAPFTVVMNEGRDKNAQEWQGFIYLDTVPSRVIEDTDEEDDYHDLSIQGRDNFPNFNSFKDDLDREEMREEEAYRKAHISRK